MRKVIAFSLWGDSPRYCEGILRNEELARTLYPDWDMWVWVDDTVPAKTYFELTSRGVVAVIVPTGVGFSGLFWRFQPATVPTIDRMISRDADSRLSARERDAVAAWEDSGLDFHTMRDHRAHSVPMLGGMWGCRPVAVAGRFGSALHEWQSTMQPGAHRRGPYFDQDQRFLRHAIYPWAKESMIAHDDAGRYEGIPFPTPDAEGHFVGEVYDVG